MRNFSIKDFERLSGVKAHTIRIWEIRYNLFSPQRKSSNIRYYSVHDLRRLLDVAFLLRMGYKISKLAAASAYQLEQKLQSFQTEEDRKIKTIDDLLIYTFCEDIDKFEFVLNDSITSWGIDHTIHNIIIPFLERADILSYNSSSTDVHFAVTTLRKKIIFGIESTNVPSVRRQTALLFLFKDEHYDLILLCINYVLKSCGIHVFYLGTNISLDNLKKVVNDKNPTVVFSYITSNQSRRKLCSDTLKEHLPQVKFHIFHPGVNSEPEPDSPNIVFSDLNKINILKEIYGFASTPSYA